MTSNTVQSLQCTVVLKVPYIATNSMPQSTIRCCIIKYGKVVSVGEMMQNNDSRNKAALVWNDHILQADSPVFTRLTSCSSVGIRSVRL